MQLSCHVRVGRRNDCLPHISVAKVTERLFAGTGMWSSLSASHLDKSSRRIVNTGLPDSSTFFFAFALPTLTTLDFLSLRVRKQIVSLPLHLHELLPSYALATSSTHLARHGTGDTDRCLFSPQHSVKGSHGEIRGYRALLPLPRANAVFMRARHSNRLPNVCGSSFHGEPTRSGGLLGRPPGVLPPRLHPPSPGPQ